MNDSAIEVWSKWLQEQKAEDIQVFKVGEVSDVVDFMMVATALNTRHLGHMGEDAMRYAKTISESMLSADGLDGREWIVLDFGDYMIHLMLPETRVTINIEEHLKSVIEKRHLVEED